MVSVGSAPPMWSRPLSGPTKPPRGEGPGTKRFPPLGIRFFPALRRFGREGKERKKKAGRGKRGCAALTERSSAIHCMYPTRRHPPIASTGFLASRRPLELASLRRYTSRASMSLVIYLYGPGRAELRKVAARGPGRANRAATPLRGVASASWRSHRRRQVPAGEETRWARSPPPAPPERSPKPRRDGRMEMVRG